MFNYVINALKFILKTIIVLFLVYLQIMYIWPLFNLDYSYLNLTSILYTFQFICIFIIGNKKYDNEFNILWLISIIVFPIIFIPIYLFSVYVRSNIIKKFEKNNSISTNVEQNDINEKIFEEDKQIYNIGKFIENACNTNFRFCDKYIYYPTGNNFFSDFIYDLKNAKKYIFINFFILSKGVMWEDIKDILIKKMNSGVKVYIIFDHLGSFTSYPRDIKKIKHNNFHLKIYNTLLSGIGPYINSRNHRKIIVIDGEIGFIGGINIADEYINNGKFKYKWKDTAIRFNGKIVNDLTNMFIKIWNDISTNDKLNINDFIVRNDIIVKDNGYLILYSDRLYNKYYTSKNVYLQCINIAKKYVYIMTPYLILDEEFTNTLIRASRSGVDIRIITPKKPDNIFVHTVTRTYYTKLLEAGISIYEYSLGFIHAKNMLIDDEIAIVGSQNFDFRSMYMLLENGILAYKIKEIDKIKNDFINTFKQSEEIELEKWKKRSIFVKIGESILKIFAPLL